MTQNSQQIHPQSVIGKNVFLGKGVIIHPFVVINDNVELGDNVEIFPGAYIGKEPKGLGILKKAIEFNRGVKIGANCSIGPNTVIYYDVDIGENTLIGDGASIREQCRVASRVIIGRYVTINYNVKIGSDTKIMDHAWLSGNMNIGERVFISGGVLATNDNKIGTLPYGQHIVGPTIEDGAKIGAGAIILPNITIGSNAVVGAGSVVTKNVLTNTIVKGIPAKS